MKILFLILTFTFFPTYGQANKKKAAPGVKGLLDNQTSIKNPFKLRALFQSKGHASVSNNFNWYANGWSKMTNSKIFVATGHKLVAKV